MKLKQEKRELRAKLKKELEELAASPAAGTGAEMLRAATLRGQLASVEAFLAHADGAQSLAPLPSPAPASFADDLESTNLYVGSLASEWTEELIMREFGKYGDVTSIKIMYPRTDIQRMRGMNCGFVQFRTRKQAETAKARLNGKDYFGMALRIDWGRAVSTGSLLSKGPNVQPHLAVLPPPQLQPHVETPPPAAAQPRGGGTSTALATMPPQGQPVQPERKSRWNKAKTIPVQIPEDPTMRKLIDVTAQFVCLEGWDFEKHLHARECNNPRYAWLKGWDAGDMEDPLHVYYRWRVFSFSQGDSEEQWRTEPFQIYDNGPLWQPPPCEHKERIEEEEDAPKPLSIPHFDIVRQPGLVGPGGVTARRRGGGVGSADLTTDERMQLDHLIAGLTLSRASILAAMVFCLDCSAASQQIAQRICGSITEVQAGLTTAQLSARLFLLSDVLFNSHCTKPGASMYRRQFQEGLPDVFERLAEVCDGISQIAASALRDRVLKLVKAWSEWSTFPPLFTKGLEATLCCRGSQRPSPEADLEVPVARFPPEARPQIRQRLHQWRTMLEPTNLERACRLRGISSKGMPRDLVERLCAFEAYWFEKEPPPAVQRLPHEEPIVYDPELDGEALDEEDIRAIAEMEQEEEEAFRAPGQAAKLLLGGQDLVLAPLRGGSGGDTAMSIEVAAAAGLSAASGGSSSSTAPAAASGQRRAAAGGPKGRGGGGSQGGGGAGASGEGSDEGGPRRGGAQDAEARAAQPPASAGAAKSSRRGSKERQGRTLAIFSGDDDDDGAGDDGGLWGGGQRPSPSPSRAAGTGAAPGAGGGGGRGGGGGGAEAGGAAAEEEPTPEELRQREERQLADERKAQLKRVESEVQRYQLALESARERAEVIAMKCDRKRMELLEALAQEEAMRDLQSRQQQVAASAPKGSDPASSSRQSLQLQRKDSGLASPRPEPPAAVPPSGSGGVAPAATDAAPTPAAARAAAAAAAAAGRKARPPESDDEEDEEDGGGGAGARSRGAASSDSDGADGAAPATAGQRRALAAAAAAAPAAAAPPRRGIAASSSTGSKEQSRAAAKERAKAAQESAAAAAAPAAAAAGAAGAKKASEKSAKEKSAKKAASEAATSPAAPAAAPAPAAPASAGKQKKAKRSRSRSGGEAGASPPAKAPRRPPADRKAAAASAAAAPERSRSRSGSRSRDRRAKRSRSRSRRRRR